MPTPEYRDNLTSLQPLGPVMVTVAYLEMSDGEICVEGIIIDNILLPSSYLAPDIIRNWEITLYNSLQKGR